MRRTRWIAAGALALVVGSIMTAVPAQAADPGYPGRTYLGDFTINGLAAKDTTAPWAQSITLPSECPATNRTSALLQFNRYGSTTTFVGMGGRARTTFTDEPGPVVITDRLHLSSSPITASWDDPLTAGDYDVIYVCGAPAGVQSAYFRAVIHVDAAGNLSLPASEEPEEAVAPTVAIASATANNDGTVTLSASVTADSAAVSDATGKVVFAATDVSGETAVGADGSAAWTSGRLVAGQVYNFTAKYVPGVGETKYLESALSAPVTVTTVAEPALPQDTDVTVVIPEAVQTGLKFTITEGDVALSAATLDAGSYVAAGELGQVKVSDNRDVKTAWTLAGVSSDFENTTDATKTIDGKYLGWAPALVGASNGGTAGAAVVAGAGNGLKTSSPLASAPAGASVVDTTVKAGISLKAPGGTAAGAYKATLTLTLI
ncbi:hypothetical protein [Compostimonas suwonensis]|uniref:Ig-like domain-containing protein n=1 Tax=Compostimonas suwonensis TaxID=1048394 RepID=A0A2M9C063_9MICO|nr:hypothetical protein [Compostimonas suwonensis]PJJ63712.1 hypothetical protein CLV54_1385 [Compostimonas suwonensis]